MLGNRTFSLFGADNSLDDFSICMNISSRGPNTIPNTGTLSAITEKEVKGIHGSRNILIYIVKYDR